MDSQSDSIDIARLKRVALGLESDIFSTARRSPSQFSASQQVQASPFASGQGSSVPKTVDSSSFPHTSSFHTPLRAEKENNGTSVNSFSAASNSSSARVLGAQRVETMSSAGTASGDTQVVSQSVFERVFKQNAAVQSNSSIRLGSGYGESTLRTFHEGDIGHIDLLAGFPDTNGDSHDADGHDTSEDNSSSKLSESSPLPYLPNLFPESQRFLSRTPAYGSKQVNVERTQNATPLVTRNPLVSDAESSACHMPLSQVFKATQALSSPLVNKLHSDFASDRPSPNIPIQNRSISRTLSSPFTALPLGLQRESSDPQISYITMKESQAARDNLRLTRSVDCIRSDDYYSDSELEREPSFVERARRQRKIDEQTRAQFAGVSAPARLPKNTSCEQGNSRRSISRLWETEQRAQNETSAIILPINTPHEKPEPPPGGVSEEETEQEDLDSQEAVLEIPYPSTEEDKENYNSQSFSTISTTDFAHGRLSQALGIADNSVERVQSPGADTAVYSQHCASLDGREHNEPACVKDSQQPPGINASQESGSSTPGLRSKAVRTRRSISGQGVKFDASEYENVVPSSPTKATVQSFCPSPGYEKYHLSFRDNMSTNENDHHSQLSSPNFAGVSTEPLLATAAVDSRVASTENDEQLPLAKENDKSSRSVCQPELISVRSQVAETPVNFQSRSFGEDSVPVTSIPETSPETRAELWTDDAARNQQDQEDDDLPPVHPSSHVSLNDWQPNDRFNIPSTKSLLNSQILTSPSGRQRRALTEIASDASPPIDHSPFDMDFMLLTDDDRKFGSLVGMSPIPPRKKRRGNDGKGIFASDPVHPITPRKLSPHLLLSGDERGLVANASHLAELDNRKEASTLEPSGVASRKKSIWDFEASPEKKVVKKASLVKRTVIRHRNSAVPSRKKVEKDLNKRPVKACQSALSTASPKINIHQQVGSHDSQLRSVTDEQHDKIESSTSGLAKIAHDQILALWRGQKRAYYPARCFGTSAGTSQSQYVVKFEDSGLIDVPAGSVKRLEFQLGDAVKVDMSNVPKVTHIIRGFSGKLSEDEVLKAHTDELAPMTDIYGHSLVILEPKQRKSLAGNGLPASEATITVPIGRLYLDTILWNQLKDRSFTFNPQLNHPESVCKLAPAPAPEGHATPVSPNTRPVSRSIYLTNGLFSGMVFAVSYVEDESSKTRVTRLILENGGRLLRDGFNELFETLLNIPVASGQSPSSAAPQADCNFRLTKSAEDVGFACLIADKHSRREKYMQALALNLPCLSGCWVEDCVAQNRILGWQMYLLPAGESIYLNGATKSRVLASNPTNMVRLCETIGSRPKLLEGQSVLLVMGRGKAEERRKAYVFLTLALGAARVERVSDLKAAKAILDQQSERAESDHWGWVYVDDYEQEAARNMLLGGKTAGSRVDRKRKSSALADSTTDSSSLGGHRRVRVVGNEFVCQSLILGKLLDD